MTADTMETVLLDALQQLQTYRRIIVSLERKVMTLEGSVDDLLDRIEILEGDDEEEDEAGE